MTDNPVAEIIARALADVEGDGVGYHNRVRWAQARYDFRMKPKYQRAASAATMRTTSAIRLNMVISFECLAA